MGPAWKWMRSVLVTGSLLAVLAACGTPGKMESAGTPDHSQAEGMRSPAAAMNKGEAAPAFSLNDLKGNTVKLADLEGKKVYVKYWASWCSICLAGLEELNTLAGQDNDFEVITIVAPDYKGEKSIQDFTDWFESQPYDNITVLMDQDGKWAKEFGIRAYPTSFYIGSDGILVKSLPGHASNDKIIETLKEIS